MTKTRSLLIGMDTSIPGRTIANKNNRPQPRKSHTNTRTLGTREVPSSTSRSAMATGQLPALVVTSAASNPRPAPSYGSQWVKRRYQYAASLAAAGTLSFSSGNFGLNSTQSCYVDKLSVWLLKLGGALKASFNQANFTDLGGNPVDFVDYGTGVALPGGTVKVPLGHAKEVADTSLALVSVPVAATGSSGQAQVNDLVVCELECWVEV